MKALRVELTEKTKVIKFKATQVEELREANAKLRTELTELQTLHAEMEATYEAEFVEKEVRSYQVSCRVC